MTPPRYPDANLRIAPSFVNGRAMLCAVIAFLALPAASQQCASESNCRSTAPIGNLLHNPNSNGHATWTTQCQPNTWKKSEDSICRQIASCPAAGAFGKFLQAVTFDCKTKHFDGYFGLDGLTYGILDWTYDNLPNTLRQYQTRDPQKFDEIFGPLKLPIKNGCLDSKWACEANRQGSLNCDPSFRGAFSKSMREPEFQKAQAAQALQAYETRLKKFASLGLKTEYGNTAMAVVANNLAPRAECRPAAWKAVCGAQVDEAKLVDCMLDQYVKNSCRGKLQGSKDRRDAIKAVFKGSETAAIVHPPVDDVLACSTNWGSSSKP